MQEQNAKKLFERYMNGVATPEEAALLEAWYAQFEHKNLPDLSESDRTAHAGRLRLHLQEHVAQPVPAKRVKWWPRVAAAAAVIIILASGIIYYTNYRQVTGTETVAQDIAPGTNSATLTLANGQVIALDNRRDTISQQGSVSVLDDAVLSFKPYQRAEGSTLAYNILSTKAAQQFTLVLADGTRLWLNAASSVRFPTSFNGSERRIELLHGEIYVEVVHNEKMPFRVATRTHIVEDLGTQFNISDYPEDKAVRTTLVEGAIEVKAAAGNRAIRPGEQAQVEQQIRIVKVDTEAVAAWKNGDFIFGNEDFKSAMQKIARWYNVEIVYAPDAPLDHVPGGWVSRSNNISTVLKMMESTGKVHFKVEGKKITVTR